MRALLANEDDLALVGEASELRAALAVVDSAQPDVVLLDLRLAGCDGMAALHELLRRAPSARVVVLSGVADADVIAEAMAAGASGYVAKTAPVAECLEGIRRVHAGETFLSQKLPPEVRELRRRLAGKSAYERLSRREREVFALLVQGHSNPEVAKELSISAKTVESHREHILKKLGMHSIVELVRFAARRRLLE